MKKFGLAAIVASGLAVGILAAAGPAQAAVDHQTWIYQISPSVSVPHVDTTVHQSR